MESSETTGSSVIESCLPDLLPMDSVNGIQEFVTGESVEQNIKIKEDGWCKRFRWIPTSASLLEQAEKKILAYIKTPYKGRIVDIGSTNLSSSCRLIKSSREERKIWTLGFNEDKLPERTPVVLVHGLCASVGLWALNMDAIAKDRTVYAFDLLGFGRSSRPAFSSDPVIAEAQHVQAIEDWRKEMKLGCFILVGHSMGGFLSSAYALKHPEHVAHLVLADPWGYPKKPENPEEIIPEKARKSYRFRAISAIGQKVNALSIVRGAGPYGPSLLSKVRPDLVLKFDPLNQNGAASISEYIYHCNAQKPTGEEAFRTMMDFFGWAKNAMYNRIDGLSKDVPLTMIYADSTWLPQIPKEELKELLPENKVDVYTLANAGHHVYADNQQHFNRIINEIGRELDRSQV